MCIYPASHILDTDCNSSCRCLKNYSLWATEISKITPLESITYKGDFCTFLGKL